METTPEFRALVGNGPEAQVRIVAHVVAQHFDCPLEHIMGRSRAEPLPYYRNLVAWIVREITDVSYPQLGRALGGRDHTTAMNAHHRAEAYRDDPDVRDLMDVLKTIADGYLASDDRKSKKAIRQVKQ